MVTSYCFLNCSNLLLICQWISTKLTTTPFELLLFVRRAVPVDVFLGSFRVNVLTVGKVETPVIVLWVIGAVGPDSSIVSCQLQINIPPFQHLGVGERSSGAAGSAAVLRQIIPSRIWRTASYHWARVSPLTLAKSWSRLSVRSVLQKAGSLLRSPQATRTPLHSCSGQADRQGFANPCPSARPAFSVGHFDPLIPLRVKSSAGWRHLILQ